LENEYSQRIDQVVYNIEAFIKIEQGFVWAVNRQSILKVKKNTMPPDYPLNT
jgi:hypothetical protein